MRNIEYAFTIDLPITKETSKIYMPDKNMFASIVSECANKIAHVIRVQKTVSLGRIFRCFEMVESPNQPYIFFDWIENHEIEQDEDGYIVTLYLYGACEPTVLPSRKENFKPYLVNPEEENSKLDEPVVTKTDENGKPISGRFPWV